MCIGDSIADMSMVKASQVEAEEQAVVVKKLAAAQAAETTEATCRPDSQMEEIALLPVPDIDAAAIKGLDIVLNYIKPQKI